MPIIINESRTSAMMVTSPITHDHAARPVNCDMIPAAPPAAYAAGMIGDGAPGGGGYAPGGGGGGDAIGPGCE